MQDPVLHAIDLAVQQLGYATKLTVAPGIRAFDETDLPLVLIESLKRAELDWLCSTVPSGTRLYRLVLVQQANLTLSAPLQSGGLEYDFKEAVLATFQGIDYILFANTPAWDSMVIDDSNFDPGEALVSYLWSSILVAVQCLEPSIFG